MPAKPQTAVSDFWKHKRVIVTGGARFLGRFVVQKLGERGAAEVIVPRSQEYDLRDLSAIRRLLLDSSITQGGSQTHKPVDMVIHLAARVGGIGANRAHPAESFHDNLMMGMQLLHESWRSGVPKFVAVGTICAYPKFTPIPSKEEDLWNGYPEETKAPYGLAKKMLLVQSQPYRQRYGYDSIFLLPVNLYGPGNNFDPDSSHVIPALIKKCLDARERGDKEIVVWGDGSPTREFLYVEDAAEGILLAAERYDKSEPVNLGSAHEISSRELVQIIANVTKFHGSVVRDTSQPNGQPRRKQDIGSVQRDFGFVAKVPFDEGLRRTLERYSNSGSTVSDYTQA